MNANTLTMHVQLGEAPQHLLSPGEVRLLSAYRRMDGAGRAMVHAHCDDAPADLPGRAANPLRLVGGTAMANQNEVKLTVAEFCAGRGLNLPLRQLQVMGKATAKYSREMGMAIGRAVDASYGEVNAYQVAALEAVAGVMCVAAEVAA